MLTVIQDVRHAARLFRRSPGVSAVLLLTLAIGIGVNTAIFSFVDAILLKPLPYPHADRIVGMWERRPSGQANAMTAFNYLDFGGPFDDIREHAAVYVSNEEDSRVSETSSSERRSNHPRSSLPCRIARRAGNRRAEALRHMNGKALYSCAGGLDERF